MKPLTLILTFIATLITPSLSYSQDEFKPLPFGRWFNERVKGGPYLAANDYLLGAKPVRWECGSQLASGGTITISDISGLLVVMAHQPDFPQRMAFFGEINKRYNAAVEAGNDGWVSRAPIPEFQPSQSSRQYRYATKYYPIEKDAIYASLLVYVYGKINNQNPSVWVPLVAYYSGGDKNLDALKYYALDCDAAHLNAIGNRYKNSAVVAPLGRADDYPAFRITVLDGDNDHYRQTWASAAKALSSWIDNRDGTYSIDKSHSIRRLFLHNLNPEQDARTAPFPTVALDIKSASNWTYGQLLRQYFDYHDGKDNRVNPPFLSGLGFSITIDALAPKDGNPWFAASTINADVEPNATALDNPPEDLDNTGPENEPGANLAPNALAAEDDSATKQGAEVAEPGKTIAEVINEVTQLTLTLGFTGEAFAEFAAKNWSNKIQTNAECEVIKLAANSAQYQLICQDDTRIRADSQIFLGEPNATAANLWLVKDTLNLNADSTGNANTIDASEVIVDRSALAAISIKYQEPSPGWLTNNGFNSTNLSQIFPNASYKLSDLANDGFGVADCTIPVQVKASDIINRSITIDFSSCQAQRAITIAYPKRYQPANLQNMQISTSFAGCAESNATYSQAQEDWRFANCFLEANSLNTFPVQIIISGFDPVSYRLTIAPSIINKQDEKITLKLEQKQIAVKLRPQLVPSATQPFGPDLNPIPNYRLAQVGYKSDNKGHCTIQVQDINDNEPILPSLSQAGCKFLPTHISYHYQRLDSNASSAPPNEAYRSSWHTNYLALLENVPTYSHDQFKRTLDIKISEDYQNRLSNLQTTRLGAQYDENDNLSGKWSHDIYTSENCKDAIGLVDLSGNFISIQQADTNLTWPLYAQITNVDKNDEVFSNCAPAIIAELKGKNTEAQVTSFDMEFKIPAGPKVAIILAISERLNQSSNVMAPVKTALRDLLNNIRVEYENGTAANVNVLKINSEDDLQLIFDGNVNSASDADINSILSQMSPEAPDNPSIADIRNHSLVKDAIGGWLLLFAGGSYDNDMSLVYLNMARHADDPAARVSTNTPNRIRLFTFNNCPQWTNTLNAMPDFQAQELVQCKSVNEPQEDFSANLTAAINELVWSD